ncbi:MAG TPA: Calx-beta domain-containing protein, partial [Verrucomicrobiae bacterium]|nr:Calx-beta domain-containing protein [Verrucomicrobiae bacterium]
MRKHLNKLLGSWRLPVAGGITFWTTILLCCGSVNSSSGYEEIVGTRGVPTNRTTVNFQRLAEWERQFKTRVELPPRPPRAIPFRNLHKQDSTNDTPAHSQQTLKAQSISEQSNSSTSISPAFITGIVGPSPAPTVSFPALEDNGTAIPPDTMGAVGPNHVMTALNSEVRIQDRQGTILSTISLNTFWATMGGPDAFDPRVRYDPYENRWIFTAAADAPLILGTNIFLTFSSSILLAVSATDDPTGNWYLYRVFADEFGNNWADYPTVGFNKQWIVVSVNMFSADFFSTFTGVQTYAFDKANVYTNGIGNYTLLRVPSDPFGVVRSFNLVPAVTHDRDLPEMYFMDVLNYGNSVHSRLRISTLSGDVGREILRLGTSITTNLVNWGASDFGFREGFAPQSGSFALIDNGDARLQDVVYRNGSLWSTHTVFLPPGNPNHSAVQWWQIAPPPVNVTNITNAITYQFGRIEDTNAVDFYAFPSIAVNRCNDVLIGFSSFSSNQFASANYAFRFANDPTNAMRDPALLKPGEGPYFKTFSGFQNRWGDYSAAAVDPANDLDLWTLQEYAETPSGFGTNSISRWGTWWGKFDIASATQCGQVEFALKSYSVQEGQPVAVIGVTNVTGMAGTVDFATSDGTAVDGANYVGTAGTLTFAAGQRSTNFSITILDDGFLNSNRTVNLSLFNVTGGASLGSLTNAVLVIADDESVLPPDIANLAGEFNFSSYYDTNGTDFPLSWMSLFWGPGYYCTDWEQTDHYCGLRSSFSPERRPDGVLVTVTRALPARGRVMVDFTTAEGGTAIPFQGGFGSGDYMPTNMTLTFDDFQTSTQILVRVRSSAVFSAFTSGEFHKYVRLVLSNPRPAPEEELENPGAIRPTLGPGASSQVVIINVTQGDPLLRFFGFGGLFSTNIPAFSFERLNYRVDEYDAGDAMQASGGFKRINVDIIKSPPLDADGNPWGGRCIFKTQDPRIAGVQLASPFFQAGSDTAECYEDPNNPTDPFRGQAVYGNPIFTDPALNTITNYSDYEGRQVELVWATDECRKTVTLLVNNDATVEFNEDIICLLLGIRGERFAPHSFADQCTVTILYHDQPAGALDREWNPDNVSRVAPNEEFARTPGANETVYAVAVQPDGKTLLGGDFTAVNGVPRNHIARMEVNGDIDTTFQSGNGPDRFVNAITLYPTNSVHFGKILIGGDFEALDGRSQKRVARLLPNGQLDTSFIPGNGADGPILGMALQSDGKVIVVGNFSTFDNVPRHNIARLQPNGALDLSFNADPGPNNTVWSVAVVPSAPGVERILIGGEFFSVNGAAYGYIAQLNSNGSLDGTFNAGSGANMPVYSLLVQPDGRILVAGGFTTMNDVPRFGVARLHANGILDESFNPGLGANDSVYTMAMQPDGKVLIGGIFTSYNTTRRMALARLRLDGTLDTSFLDTAYNQFAGFTQPVSYLPPNYITSIALQSDGNVMVGGSFLNVGGNPSARHALRNNYTVFTRADKRNRWNIARLLGGVTPGPGNVDFDAPQYFVNETSSNSMVQLNRTDGRLGTLLAVAVTGEKIATPGIDYLNATNNSAWREGRPRDDHPRPYSIGDVNPVYFKVPILDDQVEEGDELIDLAFRRADGSLNLSGEIIPLGGALGGSKAVLDVIDNDFPRGTFNFLISNYITNEFSTNAIITVIRTNGSVGSASVEYFTRLSTNAPGAVGGAFCQTGVDYQTTRGRLQFLSGQTSSSFLVRICNDDIVEFDENIELVLTNASGGAALPGGLKTSVATATLTIVDDDFAPGRINFASSTFTNNETERFAAVRVTRSGGSVGTVSVQFRTLNGTATSPADYVATNGVLTWNDGDTAFKTISIPLAQDGLVEGAENFRVELYNPIVNQAADSRLLGIRTNALATIGDGDAYGVLAFNQPFYQADENGGSVTLTVVRTEGSAGTVSVNYSAVGDSAIPGLDFTPVSGTLTFVSGQSSTTFTVPLADDSQSDGNKVVRVQLTNPVNALLGVPSAVDLVLVDNESFNNPPGELDTTFDSGAQANGPIYSIALYVTNGVPDGRLMIAGDFTNVNNIVRQGLARLNPNGTLDTSFSVGAGPDAPVRALAIQADGKVLLGGFFSQVTGTNRHGIARVNIEGTLDTFFDPGAGADGPVYAIAVQPDRKILVGGAFSDFAGQRLPGIVRLLPDGRVDSTFNAGSGPRGNVFAFAILPDGKILIGGDFIEVNGIPRHGIARLNRNGSVDTSFDPGSGTDFAAVRAVLIQPDGKIVIGGSFTTINGVPRNFLARLERDGAVDTSFMNGVSGGNFPVQALALHADGKIVVAGDFTTFNGVTRNHITRLNPDGTTDTTINFGTGANAFVAALAIQPDRRIVLGGAFTTYDNQPRNRLARIYGGSVAGAGSIEFLTQQYVVSELNTNALISIRRRGGTTGTVGVTFNTADDTALNGRDYVATNATVSFPPGEVLKVVPVPILLNPTPSEDLHVKLNLSNYTG